MRSRKRKVTVSDKHLPTDLWAQILARLPPKSVLKLRCVCKAWLSIVNNPDFISMHLNLFNNNKFTKKFILTHETNKRKSGFGGKFTVRVIDTFRKSLQISNLSKHHRIKGYCNGVLLLAGWNYMCEDLILWNPSIRKSRIIPPPWDNMYIGYQNVCAIGFDPSSKDYKILAIRLDRHLISIGVFRLRTGSWRTENVDFEVWGCAWRRNVVAQGAVHWLGCDKRLNLEVSKLTVVVSFEFGSERFTHVELPNYDDGVPMCCEAEVRLPFVLGESLAVFDISTLGCCVWVMGKDGEQRSWTKWYQGQVSEHIYLLFRSIEVFGRNLVFLEKSDTFLFKSREGVIAYGIKNHQTVHLGKSVGHQVDYLNTYVESLVLYNG